VAESGTGKAAIINLTTFMVTTEIATGPGPVRVAINGTQAIVVNGDNDTATIINLANNTVQKTVTVGRAPEGVAIDAATNRAYVVNENDGTISVIDLVSLTVGSPILLGESLRPESIALSGNGFAFVTVPASGPNGEVIVLNLATGKQTTINANPDRSGGSTDVAFFSGKLYLANQTGGSVSVIPFANGTAGTPTTIKVDLGARALAIDANDNRLVVSNEGSGTLVLVDLTTNAVVGRIDAVRANPDDHDDHGDRDGASNLPAVQSLTPESSKANTTITLTIKGTNLTGATSVVFDLSRGKGDQGDNGNDKNKMDDAFTVSNIAVNSAGTQLTATVKIAAGAQAGAHIVRVVTPNGESSGKVGSGNIFTIM
jgi:YVTN family beta-propeller protein